MVDSGADRSVVHESILKNGKFQRGDKRAKNYIGSNMQKLKLWQNMVDFEIKIEGKNFTLKNVIVSAESIPMAEILLGKTDMKAMGLLIDMNGDRLIFQKLPNRPQIKMRTKDEAIMKWSTVFAIRTTTKRPKQNVENERYAPEFSVSGKKSHLFANWENHENPTKRANEIMRHNSTKPERTTGQTKHNRNNPKKGKTQQQRATQFLNAQIETTH